MSVWDNKCNLCGRHESECDTLCTVASDGYNPNGKRASVNYCYCEKHSKEEVDAYQEKCYRECPDRNDDRDLFWNESPETITKVLKEWQQGQDEK